MGAAGTRGCTGDAGSCLPTSSVGALSSTARIDGAVAGTPFFIALVPAYIAFLRQEVRFHLRVAALYGKDPADPQVAADFLVLRGVHKNQRDTRSPSSRWCAPIHSRRIANARR